MWPPMTPLFSRTTLNPGERGREEERERGGKEGSKVYMDDRVKE